MAISNVKVVNTASKYIVKSTGIGSETDQVLVNAERTYWRHKWFKSKFNRVLLHNRRRQEH